MYTCGGNLLLFPVVVFTVIAVSLSKESSVRTRQKRVIGGKEVERGDWPWLVHLKGKIPAVTVFGIPLLYKTYFCGASLINKRWVMTAGHCFTFPNAPDGIQEPRYWHAKLGETEANHGLLDSVKNLLSDYLDEPDWRLWYLHAEKIILHPDYDAQDDWKHDIALIKLEEEIPLDDPELSGLISPVNLPDYDAGSLLRDSWPRPGTLCVMKGWGCTASGGAVMNHARATQLPIIPHYKCIFRGIGNTRLCAGYNLRNRGICAGDSGGPLVCEKEGVWVQAGLASFTSKDRPGSVPGVFTRVANYRHWIEQVIQTE